MRQIRLRKLRRRLGLYEPPASQPKPLPMDKASVRQRRQVFEQLPEYPPCPDGWTTGPPDFVIFGAQKSGTTWWFRLLEQHPGVVQPAKQRPELHFFDRLFSDWPSDEQIASYHRYFPRPEGKLAGEKTPEYMNCAWVPPMAKLAAPEAKVIVLLRDPIERYISGMSHQDRGGLLDAVDAAGQSRIMGDRVRVATDAIERGLYAVQVEWLLAQYAADRILLLQYEACAAETATQLARTHKFLGLEPEALPEEEMARPRNKAKLDKVAVPPEHIELLQRYYRPDVERLRAYMPDLDLSLWPNFRNLV